MNNHSKIEAQLAIYADLDAALRQQVDAHVQACAACAAKLHDYQAMDRSLKLLLASRVQEATRRPVELPRALVVEKPQRPLVWWEVLRYRLRQGFQRWPPVMVGAMGLALLVLFFYTYLTHLHQRLPNGPETAQTPVVPDSLEVQAARIGIAVTLERELVARHSPRPTDKPFVDPDADLAWRTKAGAILIQDEEHWQNIPLSLSILQVELLQPDLALVRLQIDYPLSMIEVGRIYRYVDGNWYWTEPPTALWGEVQTMETAHLRFEYQVRDAQVIEQSANTLEALYVALHQTLNVPLDTPIDPDPAFAGHKLTFQIVSEDSTMEPSSGPLYRVSSPVLMSLSLSERTLSERYTTQLASVVVSQVMQKLRGERLYMVSGWHIVNTALNRKLLSDHLPYVLPPRTQAESKLATLMANLYPLSIEKMIVSPETIPSSAHAGLLIAADAFVDYLEATYGAAKVNALAQTISNQTDAPDVVIPRLLNTSLTQFETGWNDWLLREYPFLQTAIDARQAIERLLPADATLVELTVQGGLARARVCIEQRENVLSPLIEGRLYRWDGEQWLRTSPIWFDGEVTKTIETENFRITFQGSDTAAVLQAAPAIESAYERFLLMLQLPRERPIGRYDFLEDGKFNIQVRPEIVTSWSPKARAIPITSPFFQSWPEKSSEGSRLAYSVMSQLETRMWEEVTDGQHWQNWGVLTSGISQWLIEESLPNPPWRGSDYLQEEIEKFFDKYFPVQIAELKSQTDANTGFVVGRLLMDYIVDEYGEAYMGPYIRGLGEYDTWDAITQATFGIDATTFEAAWNQYIATHYDVE